MPISDMSSCTELRSHSLMWATVCQTRWTMKTHIKKKNKSTHPLWLIDLDSVTKRVWGKEDRVVFSADVHFIHSCIVQNVIKLFKNVWDEKWARQLLDLDYHLAFTQKISHSFYCFHDLIQFRFHPVGGGWYRYFELREIYIIVVNQVKCTVTFIKTTSRAIFQHFNVEMWTF